MRWTVPLLLLLLSGTAAAKDYRIEVILFENLQPGDSVTQGDIYYPLTDAAIAFDSDASRAEGFTRLADNAMQLRKVAGRVANTSRYRLLQHFAWQQPGLDNKSAIALRFGFGDEFELYLPDDQTPFDTYLPAKLQPEIDYGVRSRSAQLIGNLRIRLGRFLHMDVNMVYTDAAVGRSYRLTQSRKMRSRELHYIDNERFGLLTLITPVEDPEEAEPAEATPALDAEPVPGASTNEVPG